MDVVNFFAGQIAEWDTDERCGYCWQFEAPLRVSDINESVEKDSEKCCVRVFLADLVINENFDVDQNTALTRRISTDYMMRLYFVLPGDIGQNVYTEQDYPVSESKWVKLLKPLLDCVDQGFDFCDTKSILMKQSKTVVLNWQDFNYDGWCYNIHIRQLVQ